MSDICHHDMPKANRAHTCAECLGAIQPGETYHKYHGVYDGCGFTVKQCDVCNALMRDISAELPAHNVITFGSLAENVFDPCYTDWDANRMKRFLDNADARGADVPAWFRARYQEAAADAQPTHFTAEEIDQFRPVEES